MSIQIRLWLGRGLNVPNANGVATKLFSRLYFATLIGNESRFLRSFMYFEALHIAAWATSITDVRVVGGFGALLHIVGS